MYCSNCGAKVSSDMRFCPNCGSNLLRQLPPEQAVEKVLNSMTPQQQEHFFQDLAATVVAPLRELASHYQTIAIGGPVTDDDIQDAIKIFTDTTMPPFLTEAVLPFVVVGEIVAGLRNRWFNQSLSDKEKRRIITLDWEKLTYYDAIERLLCDIDVNDESIYSLLRSAKGLRIWLKEKILDNLLLITRLRLGEKETSRVLVRAKRFFDEISDERYRSIVDGVSKIMQYVE